MTERRQFIRILYQSPATLRQAEGEWQTTVRDLSLQGVLLTCPPGWQPSTDPRYTVNFCLHECDIELTMETHLISHSRDFLRMKIHHLDIDSASHLKRLVELNVGTDELLHRELEQLTDLENHLNKQ